jgi:hypothetical protein
MKEEAGLARLARDTVSDSMRLVKLEIRLAMEGIKRQVGKKALSVGAGGAGAIFLLFGLWFGLASAAAGLAIVLPLWAALAIVAGGSILFGALLAGLAVAGLRSGGGLVPEDTKHEVREDVRWLRKQTS